MTSPTEMDVPGSEALGEATGGRMQAGIDSLPDGRFRGVVLIGHADDDLSRLHTCDVVRDTPDEARKDAQDYVDAHPQPDPEPG